MCCDETAEYSVLLAERRCWWPETSETGTQQSARYLGARYRSYRWIDRDFCLGCKCYLEDCSMSVVRYQRMYLFQIEIEYTEPEDPRKLQTGTRADSWDRKNDFLNEWWFDGVICVEICCTVGGLCILYLCVTEDDTVTGKAVTTVITAGTGKFHGNTLERR